MTQLLNFIDVSDCIVVQLQYSGIRIVAELAFSERLRFLIDICEVLQRWIFLFTGDSAENVGATV